MVLLSVRCYKHYAGLQSKNLVYVNAVMVDPEPQIRHNTKSKYLQTVKVENIRH